MGLGGPGLAVGQNENGVPYCYLHRDQVNLYPYTPLKTGPNKHLPLVRKVQMVSKDCKEDQADGIKTECERGRRFRSPNQCTWE